MRIYVNEQYVSQRAKWGRRASLIGLVVLAIGMLAAFSPNWIMRWQAEGNPMAHSPFVQWLYNGGWFSITMMSLVIGFILGQIGNTTIRRFVRSPRPDQIVAKALKGFDDRNRFYAWATPGDMVFAGPAGIYAIALSDATGPITIVNDRIRRPFRWRRLFLFGQDNPGQPTLEVQLLAEKLGKWLSQQLGSSEPIPVRPLVVFTSDNAQLDVQSASAPVLHYKQLKEYLRGQTRNPGLSKEQLKAAIERLDKEAEARGVKAET